MKMVTLFLILSLLTGVIYAESTQISLDWTVSYSHLSPLGTGKKVIVINNHFPGPFLNATTNDVVNVNIHNNLTDPFLMTWNGIQQRRNSWQDGVRGTNCPILPGKNWTYSFQIKDQIGSFFYFPTLSLHKAAGGYGAIRVNNRDVIPIPFPRPHGDFDVLIGDWFNADYHDLREALDDGISLPSPDGILINGKVPYGTTFRFEPGYTYRLRISNVGLKTSINFRIQDHSLLLVETEGSYTVKQYYDNLDVHVGQSYSVLVTAKNQTKGSPYYMVATSRFSYPELIGIGIINYPDSLGSPVDPIPLGPSPFDYEYSLLQANSIRLDLSVGAARPNPQGSYHYGDINITRTIVLENGMTNIGNKRRYTINGVSFLHLRKPLKLADYFQDDNVFYSGVFPDSPDDSPARLATSVIDAQYKDFIHIVFQNPLEIVQSWHIDGYNFFVVGMEFGTWNSTRMATYNLKDAVSRSSVQVYPKSWSAILMGLDNYGMWNVRSQYTENTYLGQELYMRVKSIGENDPSKIPESDEAPIPENVILC